MKQTPRIGLAFGALLLMGGLAAPMVTADSVKDSYDTVVTYVVCAFIVADKPAVDFFQQWGGAGYYPMRDQVLWIVGQLSPGGTLRNFLVGTVADPADSAFTNGLDSALNAGRGADATVASATRPVGAAAASVVATVVGLAQPPSTDSAVQTVRALKCYVADQLKAVANGCEVRMGFTSGLAESGARCQVLVDLPQVIGAGYRTPNWVTLDIGASYDAWPLSVTGGISPLDECVGAHAGYGLADSGLEYSATAGTTGVSVYRTNPWTPLGLDRQEYGIIATPGGAGVIFGGPAPWCTD